MIASFKLVEEVLLVFFQRKEVQDTIVTLAIIQQALAALLQVGAAFQEITASA